MQKRTKFRVESVTKHGLGNTEIYLVQLALVFVHDDPDRSDDDVFAHGVRGGSITLTCYTPESAADFVEGHEYEVAFA